MAFGGELLDDLGRPQAQRLEGAPVVLDVGLAVPRQAAVADRTVAHLALGNAAWG